MCLNTSTARSAAQLKCCAIQRTSNLRNQPRSACSTACATFSTDTQQYSIVKRGGIGNQKPIPPFFVCMRRKKGYSAEVFTVSLQHQVSLSQAYPEKLKLLFYITYIFTNCFLTTPCGVVTSITYIPLAKAQTSIGSRSPTT